MPSLPPQSDDARRRSSQYDENTDRRIVTLDHYKPTRHPSQRSRRSSMSQQVQEPPRVYIPTGGERIELEDRELTLESGSSITSSLTRLGIKRSVERRLLPGTQQAGMGRRGREEVRRERERPLSMRKDLPQSLEYIPLNNHQERKVESWIEGNEAAFRAESRRSPEVSPSPPPSVLERHARERLVRGYRSDRGATERMVYEAEAPDERRRQERRNRRAHSPDLLDDCLDFLGCYK